MTRVLITRSQPQADATAAAVANLGYAPYSMPLTQTEALSDGLDAVRALEMDPDSLVVATSARAIDVLQAAGLEPWIAKQRWAVVGERSGDRVRALGGDLSIPIAMDVAGLVDALDGLSEPRLYLAAADRKPSLEQRFPSMRVIPIYRAVALDGFSADQAAQLASEPPDFVLIFSARGAALLDQAIYQAALRDHLKAMVWLCVSQDVADQVPKGWHVKVAAAPTHEAVLALLS